MQKPTIITFSGQARHGKDTSAHILKAILEKQHKKVLAINYADYVKYIAAKYLGWDGNKDENGRTILQHLGTEKVRTRFPNFWVDAVIGIVRIFEGDYDYVVIADCRFENEIHRWQESGYKILTFHVERPGFDNELTAEQKNHPSEVSLNHFNFTEYIKAKNLQELEQEIENKILPLLY